VLRKISGPKRDEVVVEWRRYVEEIYDRHSPIICRVIRLIKMSWGEDVTCMGGKGEAHRGFWWGDLGERDLL
jgi:hypothetical protein